MALASLLAGGWTAHRMRVSTIMAGGYMPGMSEQEVRYLRGTPEQVLEGGSRWLYRDGETALTLLRFAPDKRVRSVSCFGEIGQPTGCSDIMGLTLGASEDQVVNRLGPPGQRTFVHDGKILAYGDMGIAFTLRESRVVAITKVERSDALSFLPRIGWNLLP